MKKLVLLAVLSSLVTGPYLHAQVTLDGTPQSVATDAGTSHTLTNIVIGNHPNRLLLIGASENFGTNTTDMTGCVFNTSETMTKLIAINVAGEDTSQYLWYLKQPTVTTASVVCTTANSNRTVLGSLSFYNVNQTSPFRDSDSASGTTGTSSGNITLTTVAGDYCAAIINVGKNVSDPTDLVPGGTQSEKWDLQFTSASLTRGGGSTFIATGTSTNLSYTWTNNNVFTFVAAAVQPVFTVILLKHYYDQLK